MKKLLVSLLLCACAITATAQRTFKAYNGLNIVTAPAPPVLYHTDGSNNFATGYDTSFISGAGSGCVNGGSPTGGTCYNFDGSSFTNHANLSPITRVTDVHSGANPCDYFFAGQGGSGDRVLTNLDTTLVALGCNGGSLIGIFNPTGANKGFFSNPFAPTRTGQWITTNMCTSGCTGSGSSTLATNFGLVLFSATDNNTMISFGGTSTDNATVTQIKPVTINNTTGAYAIGSVIVDLVYGLPQQNAPAWVAFTTYHYGDFIYHDLTTSEMFNATGAWTASHVVVAGDIIDSFYGGVSGSPTTHCAYLAEKVSPTGGTTGTSLPHFINNGQCTSGSFTDGAVSWRALCSRPRFVYQETATCSGGCASAAFSISGHPDWLSTVVDGSATWTNIGPANDLLSGHDKIFWGGLVNASSDANYGGYPQTYARAISINTYGCASGPCSTVGYSKWSGDQGTGADIVLYNDNEPASVTYGFAGGPVFHHLTLATGIWTMYPCTGGMHGGNCTVGTPITIGALHPNGSTYCPTVLHDAQMNRLASAPFLQYTGVAFFGSGCPSNIYMDWDVKVADYSNTMPLASLQSAAYGLNHSTLDNTILLAATGKAGVGWFNDIYTLSSGVNNTALVGTSVYLKPGSPATPETGCVVGGYPSCDWGSFLDAHESCVAGCDHGIYAACGTVYNYTNFGPAVQQWQNFEACWPTSSVSTSPSASFGPVSQFTHDFNTKTARHFDTQFGISQLSQDGNWIFWSSDLGCNTGLVSNSIAPNTGSGYNGTAQSLLLWPDPDNPITLCGLPWQPGHTYKLGQLINPIEGTTGTGAIDDVFQNQGPTATTTTGPNSSIGSNQPACLQSVGGVANKLASCFAGSNPPSTTTPTITKLTSVCAGVTCVATITLSTAVQVNVQSATPCPAPPYTVSCIATGTQVQVNGFTGAFSNYNESGIVTGGTPGAGCPGTSCAAITTFQVSFYEPGGAMPSCDNAGSPTCTASGPATLFTFGDVVCDDLLDNGHGNYNSINGPSCSTGSALWADVGTNTQRGDVLAVNIFTNSTVAPGHAMNGSNKMQGSNTLQ